MTNDTLSSEFVLPVMEDVAFSDSDGSNNSESSSGSDTETDEVHDIAIAGNYATSNAMLNDLIAKNPTEERPDEILPTATELKRDIANQQTKLAHLVLKQIGQELRFLCFEGSIVLSNLVTADARLERLPTMYYDAIVPILENKLRERGFVISSDLKVADDSEGRTGLVLFYTVSFEKAPSSESLADEGTNGANKGTPDQAGGLKVASSGIQTDLASHDGDIACPPLTPTLQLFPRYTRHGVFHRGRSDESDPPDFANCAIM